MLKWLNEHPVAVAVGTTCTAAACLATIWQAISHQTIPEAWSEWRRGVTWPVWHYVLAAVLTAVVVTFQLKIIMLVRQLLGSAGASQAEAPQKKIDYDPAEKKIFSVRTPDEFFEIGYSDKTTREKDAALKPHKGLWLAVEGAIKDITDDAGDDGQGGQWVKVVIDYQRNKPRFVRSVLEYPRPLALYFAGEDGTAIRALAVGDFVKANGRIESFPSLMHEFVLVPAELVHYGRGIEAPTV
ncbi:MAG TPA: hypothetical protein VFX12_13470 [Vicinamibacterales bacterium]|nr:hypothetical protein [Vicinamibacterales bacterium]